MSTPPGRRSVKIADDERGGWSSDRPRREGAPRRPPDISVRCQVLAPSDRVRYSPGSLLLMVSGSESEAAGLAGRVLEHPGPLLSLEKVRGLLAGRVAEEEMEERAGQLLQAAALKRLEAGDSTVVAAGALDVEGRERFARIAAAHRRPRHLVLVETARDRVAEEDRATLNELRRRIDAGELGAEGFQTAMRLGGASLSELKRIVFAPAPRDD